MSKTVAQIFAINPTTVVADTDLYYLVQSPYTPGTDAAITGASLKAAFGSGGTINPGLANQLGYYATSGSAISGLTSLSSGTLVTSPTGVPSISQTLPSAVQGNITTLGTITIGTWNGSLITGTFGGTGVNNGSSTITVGGNFAMSGAFTFTGTLTGNTAVTFPTSGTLAITTQLPTPSALTKTDDTNVTLTLGGSPTVALLAATSLTLGWTGQLSVARGGTGISSFGTGVATALGQNVNGSGAISLTTSPTFVTPVLGVAAATSINFGGTALANYVEGTFTPTVTLVGGAGNTVPVYSTNQGTYTRIGNMVFVDVVLTGDGGAEGAGTGVVNIALPITASASNIAASSFPCGTALNLAVTFPLYGQIAASATTISLNYLLTISSQTGFTGASQNNSSRTIQLKFAYQV